MSVELLAKARLRVIDSELEEMAETALTQSARTTHEADANAVAYTTTRA